MAEFKRGDNGDTLEIVEVNMQQSKTIINVDGKRIPLFPLKVNIPGEDIKCYVLIERIKNEFVTLVDLVYGNIDLNGMKQNPIIRDRYLEALSRKNIEMFTRKYMGSLPPILPYDFGQLSPSFAITIANAFKDTAYSDLKVTKTKINDMFEEKSNKGKNKDESVWKLFVRFATRNNPNTQNKNNSTKLDLPGNSNTQEHVVKEGILYYPSGAVIIDEKICYKFNYCTKDSETGTRTEVDSFLVSGVNLEKLSYDKYYRKNFVAQVCVPSRLKNIRGKMYPYIGCFNSQEQFENDFGLAIKVHKLRDDFDSRTID